MQWVKYMFFSTSIAGKVDSHIQKSEPGPCIPPCTKLTQNGSEIQMYLMKCLGGDIGVKLHDLVLKISNRISIVSINSTSGSVPQSTEIRDSEDNCTLTFTEDLFRITGK
jgi:hypothetical protein